MQQRASLFQVDGSTALKPNAAVQQARIIAFPGNRKIDHPSRKGRVSSRGNIALRTAKYMISNVLDYIDETFSVTSGTAKGLGPRYASRGETAAIIVSVFIVAFLAIAF